MAHSEDILELIENWQTKRFRPTGITFAEAAASLTTDAPLVVAKPGNNQSRWLMMNAKTDKAAILVFAGIWKWGSDLETGNFVPRGKQAPDGTPTDRIQQCPSFKCELTYTFDTSVDSSLWDYLKVFEDHVTANEGFNIGNRPRRKWQDGKDPEYRDKYLVTSKIFTRRTPFNSKANGTTSVPYRVHSWISNAIKEFEDLKQMPNPERPQYYDFRDGVLRKLEDTHEPRFNRNDIILVSCKVAFVVSGESWWTEIVPLELIRVDKIPEVESGPLDVSLYPSESDNLTPLELGEPLELFDESSKTLKRKERESEEPSPVPDKRQTLETGPDPETKNESSATDIREPHDESPVATTPPKTRPESSTTETPEASNRPNLRPKSSRDTRATRA